MSSHLLSKSTFLRGQQCEKSLYLHKNFPHLRDPLSLKRRALFARGHNVGNLARQLFPGGVSCEFTDLSRISESVEKTTKAIQDGEKIIYEGCFNYEGSFCAIDILVKNEQTGKWNAYEVKSSAKITQVYLADAAFQYYVMNSSGLEMEDFFLITVDTSYVQQEEFNPFRYFKPTSVLKEVQKGFENVDSTSTSLKQTLLNGSVPEKEIGPQCFSPYPCDFQGLCWRHVPKNSVFEIKGLSRQDQFSLYDQGIVLKQDVPLSQGLPKDVYIQVKCEKENAAYVDKPALAEFYKGLQYPVYFMDMEVDMPAVPLYPNSSPYERIPFQFSVHKLEEDGTLTHSDYLCDSTIDDRRAFLEKLCTSLETSGSIIIFDPKVESEVLTDLKKRFPEYADRIESIRSRFIDLMKIFEKRVYYHPKMNGSCSIKNVLPIVDPSLNYDQLNISNGMVAMQQYQQLSQETDLFKILEIRENLLEYCKLDTFSLVKVYQFLKRYVE